MLAASAVSQDPGDPLSGLRVHATDPPEPRTGWSIVRVVASTLNMHDLWTLQCRVSGIRRTASRESSDATRPGTTRMGTPSSCAR